MLIKTSYQRVRCKSYQLKCGQYINYSLLEYVYVQLTSCQKCGEGKLRSEAKFSEIS